MKIELNYTNDIVRNRIKKLKVIHVCELIRIHVLKPINVLMLKLYFLHTICHNSDVFLPILIIMHINTVYIRGLFRK